ncbi:bifunctional UDP-N-acetylmuramoyl-tripeptide:D-alanyl-D-alanine ligase/alanine racemase [Emticicia sp. BO119]|uniref:bifunctional UDP-N-acetylmuramoyl-tripeptide:D-alanyl-D-alanine ligase/alanine racemase n=1 Tax=Emticicia sp. BO119 TaxID=2757768 RepID=UPI0015F11053|nr:bifunctional UDP-N-acetylmuramoyl-tripeptide:D-alanyl-D-alanine ligase/alanine racemase [Emticicia sp. BO119]MBA4848815.1 bifunctional UDP-N-acetylmuramoyl-tripeptide:D-alanyl-D-alanine ligase/alanine racemase [Emticicia sp. BO119]
MNFFSEPIITGATVLLTDSRFVSQPQQSIFFAIKGERHDGHNFIEELYEKGVREFVVEKKAASPDLNERFAEAKFWLVENGIRALQNLAAEHRRKYTIPVIGITGSNGKTIVKEWLSTLLAKDYTIIKSPRSYNSQIGVGLSVWQMNESHTLGIFEAGISKSGEMENLEPIISPNIGIFTNIGSAHDEGFRSRKQKVTEKLRLFRRSKTLIYCKDYEEIDEEIKLLLRAVNPRIELIGWSKHQESPINVTFTKSATYTTLAINWNAEEYEFRIPFTDDASIENATHCVFAKLLLTPKGQDLSITSEALMALKPIAMRLELKQGINDCYLIDDTYNNDYAGLNMALNFMSQHHTKDHKILIISDLLQSGLKEIDLYKSIADLVKGKEIDQLIGIGEDISRNARYFDIDAIFFRSTENFLEEYPINQFHDSLILVKGARKFAFEKIVERLIQKVHGTVFEINLDALTHNLNFYRGKIGSDTRIMVMVKAYAYGSGSAEVASLLEYHRVDYLGVAYPDEGVALRQNGIKLPVMVLNSQPETFSKLIEYDLEPEIYSFQLFKRFQDFIRSFPEVTFKIHIKLDTGMHRLGFEEQDIDKLIELLKHNPAIKIASIFSHLVGADESEHNDFSRSQIERFKRMSDKIIQALPSGEAPLRHICNSAGIIRFPEARFDMVRLGIGLYGVEATGTEQKSLQTVGTLKTIISQIKHLKKGETIGYSRKGILEKDSRIATIAIGYADGFDRGFSKGVGVVLVNGTKCPVIGNVCMDMTMIDVTEARCEEGDEVIIFGKDLPIHELASSISTIPYEILTGVSERVKRVFYKE